MASLASISFDRFPNRKGAATHIAAFASGLASAFGAVDLVTVPPLPEMEQEKIPPGVIHHPLPTVGATLIERVMRFRAHLGAWWRGRYFDVAHIRSIYEGYPIARNKEHLCRRLVFEVNGLPSIELKYTYPGVADDRELINKLRAQEQTCLAAADLIVTVSQVNAAHLIDRGAGPEKIRIIPNGIHPSLFPYSPPRPWSTGTGGPKLLYAGTLAPWQGVATAIESLALIRRDLPATLTLVGSARRGQRKALQSVCWDLGVHPFVTMLHPVSQADLCRLHHESDVILAPLQATDRNIVQGCCPLKILEAMATGTPLVASNLPVVRELVGESEAVLVRPGSAKAIKAAILQLRNHDLAMQLSNAARAKAMAQFTWQRSQKELVQAYEEVLGIHRSNSADNASTSASG